MSQFFNSSPSLQLTDQDVSGSEEDEKQLLIQRGLINFLRKKKIRNLYTILHYKQQYIMRYCWGMLNSINRTNQIITVRINSVFVYWDTHWKIKQKASSFDKLKLHMKNQRIKQLKVQYLLIGILGPKLHQQKISFISALKKDNTFIHKTFPHKKQFLSVLIEVYNSYMRRIFCLLCFKVKQKIQKQENQQTIKNAYTLFGIFSKIGRKQVRFSFTKILQWDIKQQRQQTNEDSPQIFVNALQCICFLSKRQIKKSKMGKNNDRLVDLKSQKLKFLLIKKWRREKDVKNEYLYIWHRKIIFDRMQIMERVKQLQSLKQQFIQNNF